MAHQEEAIEQKCVASKNAATEGGLRPQWRAGSLRIF